MAGSLTDFQKAVQNLERQTGINGQAIYNSPQYAQLVKQWFGDIPVPPGAEVVSQSPFAVTYKDAFGNTRTATRNMDARYGDFGSVSNNLSEASTQGPLNEVDIFNKRAPELEALLQNFLTQQQSRSDLINRMLGISDRLEASPTLGTPDPSVAGLLAQINNNAQTQLNNQFQNQQAQLTADLFGSGINRSSIAADQAGRLMGQQGLAQAQLMSDAAQRDLGIRQFLAQMQQQNLALSGQNLLQGAGIELEGQKVNQQGQMGALNFLSQILNQSLQRELGVGSLGLQERGQSLAERQALDQNQFNLAQLDLAQKQARGGLLKAILGGAASLGGSLLGGPLGGRLFGSVFGQATGGGGSLPAWNGSYTSGMSTGG